jgi:outer membrane protein assembly factor BamB
MPDSSSTNSSPTNKPTNTSLEDLPALKADLEEARQLLSRLEARRDTTDPDRYERLRARYQEQIDALEPTVERLTDKGETRRIELQDRQAHQQDKTREADGALEEIESLYEDGAMGEEAYRKDRRRLRRQKKDAESKGSEIKRELDEVEFYLTETGEVSYQTERLRGQAESALGAVTDQVGGAVRQAQQVGQDVQFWLGGQGGRLRSVLVWGGLGTLLLVGVLYGLLVGFGGAEVSMFRGGLARTGVYDGPGPEAPVRAAWRLETDDEVNSSPAVAGGTVYVGSADGHLYAIDAETGREQWRFETGDRVVSSPAVAGGTVYVGSIDDHLYAIDAETGQEQWRFRAEGSVFSSPAVAGGTVYVGSFDGHLYAIDAETGQEQWRFRAERNVDSSPAVAGGTVYVGSFDGHLYAIDAETGQEQWRFRTGYGVSSSPAVAGGTVYVGSADGNLYAIDAETGREQWRFQAEDAVRSSPAVAGGTVYVGSFDDHLYAIDAETGQEQWRFETDEWVRSSPAVAGGTVYVGSFDGHLYALQ